MAKLKTINLKELRLKNFSNLEKINSLDFSLAEADKYRMAKNEEVLPFVSEKSYYKQNKIMENDKLYQTKFLPYVNIIKDIEEDKNPFVNKDKFEPSKDLKKEIVPLTFKKHFYQVVQKDILKMAVESPNKLQSLIENVQIEIQKDAFLFLDKQVKEMVCQIDNYASKARIIKVSKDFQKNAQQNTSCTENEQLLIIDSSLHKQIELEEYKEEERHYKDGKTFPLPLRRIWGQFYSVIIAPLENNFKFIVMDRKTLIGWYKFQKLEIKHDEEHKFTYFLRSIYGGFKQMPYLNAMAFVQKD
ncbi:4441_t:CDS:2 [Entrophospora sp. SA101]|nr:13319_t:CDS:2 [Entrophospora sp. SA101]CAJ0846312.1 4441_t:CDS:2 [Entrophospora sp. SA101]